MEKKHTEKHTKTEKKHTEKHTKTEKKTYYNHITITRHSITIILQSPHSITIVLQWSDIPLQSYYNCQAFNYNGITIIRQINYDVIIERCGSIHIAKQATAYDCIIIVIAMTRQGGFKIKNHEQHDPLERKK